MRGSHRWGLLVAALVMVSVLGLMLGATVIAPARVWHALTGTADPTALAVVRALRLPRIALAALVGAGLGISGTALQGSLRNPLAEPYLLGVSGGAAVGAAMAFALGAPPVLLPIAAFIGAAAAVSITLLVARVSGVRAEPRVLLTAGVVVGAFANAVIMVSLAHLPADTVRNALWWMMGSVAGASWVEVRWLAGYLLLGALALVAWARDVDILTLGEDAAAGLGVDVDRAARRIYLVAALVAAATVSAAGLVGFVGLVVPHLARGLGFRAHRALLPASALAGASLLVLADLVARAVRPPFEFPLGAVTAILGVPFFLIRLRRLA